MGVGLNNKLYIGVDLGEESAMLSYFHSGMERPATISSVAGSSDYHLPIVMAKRNGIGQWVYGKEALRMAKEGKGTLADRLFVRAIDKEVIVIEEKEYQARELFILFFKKILSLPNKLDIHRETERVVIAVRRVSAPCIELLFEVREALELGEEQFEVVDYKECFYFYHCNQEEALQNHKAGLFDGNGEEITYLELEKNQRTKPVSVEVREAGYGILKEERDASFLQTAQEALAKKIISAVYFVGDTFDGGWMKESLQFICRGRRAFLGKNLYSLGACFAAYQKNDGEWKYVYFGDSEFKMNISLKVRRRQELEFYSLVTAGENWYRGVHSCDVILDGTNTIELWLQHPYGREAKIENLEMADLPERPAKTTRMRVTARLLSDTRTEIEIQDLGFGEFFPSSGKIWKYTMEF